MKRAFGWKAHIKEHTENDETFQRSVRSCQSEEGECMWKHTLPIDKTSVSVKMSHHFPCVLLCVPFIQRSLQIFGKSHPILFPFLHFMCITYNAHFYRINSNISTYKLHYLRPIHENVNLLLILIHLVISLPCSRLLILSIN